DRDGVMYLGNRMELAASDELYETPLHPYTQVLLSAVPLPDPQLERGRERRAITGELPSPIDPPSGCVFRTGCPCGASTRGAVEPVFQEYEEKHWVACHMYDKRFTDYFSQEETASNQRT